MIHFRASIHSSPLFILSSLLEGLEKKEITACTLGLAHSLSRYKLKFSPDKVDTMIIQAISLLDDLDKELNNYTMRLREWFGWHFPEMGKIVTDNIAFAKVRPRRQRHISFFLIKSYSRIKIQHLIKFVGMFTGGFDDAIESQLVCFMMLAMQSARGSFVAY